MIKVCHMTSSHKADDVRIFQKECTSLAAAGYETYLVAQGGSYEANGVHIVGAGPLPQKRWKRLALFAHKIYKTALSVDADIYHFHDPELLPYGLKLKRKGKKVIFDSHEHTAASILETRWIPVPLRKSIYVLFSAFQKHVCKTIDAVITVTPNLISFFSAMQPNTVQVSNYPILDNRPQRNVVAQKKKQIVFAGGITDEWCHHTILEALEKLPDCRYVLCGRVNDNRYLERLKMMKAWPQVDFRGQIPHSEVAGILSESAVGLAVLRPGNNTDGTNGSMGNTKIFEEMMAKLPVVCTGFKRWREFVEGYKCGICVDSTNAEEIATGIRYLLDHPAEAQQMGENGYRAVKEKYNWAVEEKKLLTLYKTVS